MTASGQVFGKNAENHAVRHLTSMGYTILETNYRTRFAEIDIIARHRGTTVFIEVKARKSLRRGMPAEAVTPAKQKKIITAASVWLKQRRLSETRVRFDVVSIVQDRDTPVITVIEHAFDAG